jgi:thioredoxin 1
MKPIVYLMMSGTLVLVGLSGCGSDGAAQSAAAKPQVVVDVAAAKPANVLTISSNDDFDQALRQYADRLVVVDFHADWCGQCKLLAPELAAVAAAHPGALIVLTVDVEKLPKLADKYLVEGLPLLVQIKDGKEINRHVGLANRAQLTTWMGLP